MAVRKATVCALGSRYVLKLGGLNEFDYINKIIELYDSATDKWALVRASPRNILEEVQLLEDSLALQVSEDQVYVFGGRNSNKYASPHAASAQIRASCWSSQRSARRRRARPRSAGSFGT